MTPSDPPVQIEYEPGSFEYSEVKGWLDGVIVHVQARRYRLVFYDPVRLSQEISDELAAGRVFHEPNLIVVPSVNQAEIERAIRDLV